MKGYHIQKTPIEERAVAIAEYIVKNKATVRQAAGQFGVSKSTVHKDVTERLLRINPSPVSYTHLTLPTILRV